MPPVHEPFITWNLFLTLFLVPLCVSLLYLGIRRLFEKGDKAREEKDHKIAKLLEEQAALLAEKEELKETAIHEWRGRFEGTLCQIKAKVEEIAETMHDKVPFGVCDQREAELKQAVRDLDTRMRQAGR
jgi:hypothetical protein